MTIVVWGVTKEISIELLTKELQEQFPGAVAALAPNDAVGIDGVEESDRTQVEAIIVAHNASLAPTPPPEKMLELRAKIVQASGVENDGLARAILEDLPTDAFSLEEIVQAQGQLVRFMFASLLALEWPEWTYQARRT